jgi:hypothetical protein
VNKTTKKNWTHKNLKRWFSDADKINHNYAQSDQDIFVLSMLNGKHNGTYLEIGAGWPEHISNTALLELELGWNGISIDQVDDYPDMWLAAGRQNLVKANALVVDFEKLLSNMPTVIDYLSMDCEPAAVTFGALQRLPWHRYKFKVITFEHECYCEGPEIKIASRKFLSEQGYQLVADNISHMGLSIDYEDWWVHPDLVDPERLQSHLCVDNTIKNHRTYLYK